jgi:signal transduction histidine kinase
VDDAGPPSAALAADCERLEELCRALEVRAEVAERSHRETVSTISHDLRNPLSVILVSSRMLLRSLAPDAPGRKQIEAIVRAADEINQLAQDLVDATSIERGALRVGRDPQEIAPIVDRALEAVSYAATARPLEISRELTGDLPQVAGDRERLAQTIAGLLTNAIRFTPKGGKITVRAERWGSGARFSIVDTGAGVPEEQRDQLFARFPTTRRPPIQLVGLGPFVAKGIVEAHGGAIWADSAPGQGTTVYFTIPAATT